MQYALKDLLIDTEARTVKREGAALKLQDLSFDVLVKLVEAGPAPVSSVGFAAQVWDAEHVSDETVAQRITLVRKALGDDVKDPTYIRTVRGVGYAIAGPVTTVRSERPHTSKSVPYSTGIATTGLAAVIFIVGILSTTDDPSIKRSTTIKDAGPASEVSTLIERASEQLRLHQARETDRAIAMLREALAQDPDNFDGRITLSFALSTKATKFGGGAREKLEAETLARALIKERPDSSNAWSALAYTLGAQGRSRESLPAYQYAYQLNPQNLSAISSAAYEHLIRGDLHQALLLENRALQAGGTSRYAEIQIAQSLELIGHPAAQKWQTKALTLNPGQVVILSEIARSYLRQGKPTDALEILSRADGDDQFAPQILQLRGRAALALGNIDEAREHLTAAGGGGYYEIAALNAAAGNIRQAEEMFRPTKLAELETSDWPEDRVYFAEISAALGQKDEALRLIAQAVNLGWRDANWLKQSPFLGDLMSSDEGRKIERRIAREVEAQRRLIEATEELAAITGR